MTMHTILMNLLTDDPPEHTLRRRLEETQLALDMARLYCERKYGPTALPGGIREVPPANGEAERPPEAVQKVVEKPRKAPQPEAPTPGPDAAPRNKGGRRPTHDYAALRRTVLDAMAARGPMRGADLRKLLGVSGNVADKLVDHEWFEREAHTGKFNVAWPGRQVLNEAKGGEGGTP